MDARSEKDEVDLVKQLKTLFIETKAPYEDKSAKYVIPMNPYNEVYPNIILGNSKLAIDLKDLAANRITHVLNCSQGKMLAQVDTDEKFFEESRIKFYGIPAEDIPGFKLSQHFMDCANFIEASLQSGGRIYVHCRQGLSRSATIVIAFLMMKRGLTVIEAATTIRTKRPVLPNDGFLKQLCDLNADLYQTDQVPAPSGGAMAADPRPTDTAEATSKVELMTVDRPLIFFDLETTGLAHTSDITQIAAVCGDQEFATYVLPNQPLDPGASKVTGLTVIDSVLHHHGEPVDCQPISEALPKFLLFLKKFDRPLLAAHNGKRFDVPILKNHLQSLGLIEEFSDIISGFIDTLMIARSKIEKSALPNGSYRQENLVTTLLQKSYDAHNAIADVRSLQELYKTKIALSNSELEGFLFTIADMTSPNPESTYRQPKSESSRVEEQIDVMDARCGKDEVDPVEQLKTLLLETKAYYEDKSAKYVKPMNPYNEVYPNIILGNSKLATNVKDLAANRITHVLNCCQGKSKIFAQVNTDEKFFEESGIKFHGISAKDIPGFQLSHHFMDCANFIEESLQSGGE